MRRRGAAEAAAELPAQTDHFREQWPTLRSSIHSEAARSVLALALSCLLHLLLLLLPSPGQLPGWGEQGRSPGQEALSLFLLPFDPAPPLETAAPRVRGTAGGPVHAEGSESPASPPGSTGAAAPSTAAGVPPVVEEAPPAGEAPHPAEDTPQVGEEPSPVAAAVKGPTGGGPEAASAGASGPGLAGSTPEGSGGRPWHPVPRSTPLPDYPPLARREGKEGTARLWVEVLPSGSVGRIELLASSGHLALDRAALEAVRRWSFTPAPQPTLAPADQQKKKATGTDQPVPAALPAPVWVAVAVRFALLGE